MLKIKKSLRIFLFICISLSVCSCAKETTVAALANCEADFYCKEGTQSVDTANLEYLQRKGEHCRVCMFSKGHEINTSQYYGDLIARERKRILTAKDLWTKRPAEMTPAEANFVNQAHELAFSRASALSLCTTPFWKD